MVRLNSNCCNRRGGGGEGLGRKGAAQQEREGDRGSIWVGVINHADEFSSRRVECTCELGRHQMWIGRPANAALASA